MQKLFTIFILLLLSFSNIAQEINDLPAEIITIQTDRNEYIPGENIWFKVFTNNANKKNTSKVGYIEIISPYGFSVNRKRLPIKDGGAHGNFVLPDSLSTGYYTMLFYTNYNKNVGISSFANKKILIYNPEKDSRNNKISFYNDSLKHQIENDIEAEGFIDKSNQHNTIEINNLKKTYNFRSQVELSLKLPENTKSNSADLCISVRKYFDYNTINHLNNKLNNTHVNDVKKQSYKENYGSVIQGEIIDNNKNPVSNIIVYLSYVDSLSSIQFAKTDTHGKFEFNISSNKNLNDLVIKADSKKDVNIIINHLNNKLSNTHVNDVKKQSYWENYGPVIQGKIIDNNNNPVSNINVYLSYVDSLSSIQFDKTDTHGKFKFIISSNKNLNDLVIKADSKKDVNIIIDENFLDNYNYLINDFKVPEDSAYILYLERLYLNSRINKLYKVADYQDDTSENDDYKNWRNYNFYGTPTKVVHFDYYVLLDSIHEYFHEFFPSVFITNKSGKRAFRIVNENKEVLRKQPAIFIDGVFYEDPEVFFAINPDKCERIELINSDYIIFDKVFGGIISLYTKKANLKNIQIPYNSSWIEYKLFDPSDIYLNVSHTSFIPDFRNTLFWDGTVKINKNDTYTVNFMTGDDKSKYELVIYGFTKEGKLIHEVRTFYVK